MADADWQWTNRHRRCLDHSAYCAGTGLLLGGDHCGRSACGKSQRRRVCSVPSVHSTGTRVLVSGAHRGASLPKAAIGVQWDVTNYRSVVMVKVLDDSV